MNQADGSVFKDRRILKDRRVLKDRRKQSPPASSPFKFWWQKTTPRREVDRKKSGYVDLYSGALLFLVLLILGLDVLDSLIPRSLLDLSGWEGNPILRTVIEFYRDRFWVSKVAFFSIPLVLLGLHSKFRLAMSVILGICLIKMAVLLYQLF